VAAALRPDVVEAVYARDAYPRIAAALAAIAGGVPFSLAETLVAAAGVGLAALFARAVRGTGVPRGRRIAAGAVTVAAVAAVVYVIFLVLWGFNYHRLPVASSLGLNVVPSGRDELAAAAAELVALADRLRASVDEGPDGVIRLARGRDEALARAGLGFDAVSDRWPVLRGPKPSVKGARLSPVLARLGISGIFVPFTGEPHVNTTLPEWTIPFTAAHEVAHQRGFAREDEANYLAYLAGMHHPDPDARYSAGLEASLYALSALRRVDRAASGRIEGARGPGARRDLAALEAWRERYVGRAAAVNQRVNDAYLRSQGQADGVQSYGRMVDLLLAERRARATREPGSGLTGLPTGPAPP
jgi:hypothetical protein